MSSLIVTIIGIALMAFLITMGVNYSSGNFAKATVAASATKYLAEVKMVDAANHIFQSEHSGKRAESLQQLVDEHYVKALPSGDWMMATVDNNTTAVAKNIPEKVCMEINKMLGVGATIPSCAETGKPSGTCCT